MTFEEFQERITGAIDDAVETLMTIAPVGRGAWLGRFEYRVATQWAQVFRDRLEPAEIAAFVEISAHVQARLAEAEAAPVTVTLH
jgi:hypothetical protein